MPQLVTDLALDDLPIEQPEFGIDPTPYVDRARSVHPWLARASAGYVLLSYGAMKDILFMDDKLRMPNEQIVAYMGGKGTNWGRFQEEMLLAKTGSEHLRLRAVVRDTFSVKSANNTRPLMREVVSELLGTWAPKGRFDFAEFAAYFPISVLFGLIGAGTDALPRIRGALEAMGESFALDPNMMPKLEAAFNVLWEFVDSLVNERVSKGVESPRDLLDELIELNRAGDLTDVEVRDMLILLFGAGYDTSKNLLTLIMLQMVHHPEYWKRCASDRAFCDKVVEEALRYSSVATAYRTVAQDFVYRDVVFPAGTMLIIPLPLSGRDAEIFPEPLSFDPQREDRVTPHIAFGRGAHFCLGMNIARAQVQEGVHLIAQRLLDPKLTGEVKWRLFPGVWGLQTLPITFTAGQPAPERDVSNIIAA